MPIGTASSSVSSSEVGDSGKGPDEAADSKRMSFGEHLDELRACLIRAIVGIAIGAVVSLIFARQIMEFVLAPAAIVLRERGESPDLLAFSPAGVFLLYLKIGFLSGLVLSAPWALYQVWVFVGSGLYAKEKRFVRRFVPVSIGLFFIGVAFMYFIVLPIVMNFFVMFSQGFEVSTLRPGPMTRILIGAQKDPQPAEDVELQPSLSVLAADPRDPPVGAMWFNMTDSVLRVKTSDGLREWRGKSTDSNRLVRAQFGLQEYVSMVFALALGFGLAFELPVLVVFLAAMKIVSTKEMGLARKYVLFGIVFAAAVMTPPDVVSQVLLAIPMYALFESGLFVARRFENESSPAG